MKNFDDLTFEKQEAPYKELTNVLQHMYQQPLSEQHVESDQEKILTNARQRLSQATTSFMQETRGANQASTLVPLRMPTLFKTTDLVQNTTSAIPHTPPSPFSGERQRGWKRRISVLAATLFVALLVGGFLTVLNATRSKSSPSSLPTTGPVGTIVSQGVTPTGNGPLPVWQPHGNRVAGSVGQLPETWDALTGANVITYHMPFRVTWEAKDGWLGADSWSPDGSRVVFLNNGGIAVFNARTAVLSQSLPVPANGQRFYSSSWSPDGKYLAFIDIHTTKDLSGQLEVWDVEKNQVVVQRDTGMNQTFHNALMWSPNGQYVAVWNTNGNTDSTLQLWNPVSWQIVETYKGIISFAWSPDGKQMAVSHVVQTWDASLGATISEVQVVDTASGGVLHTFGQGAIRGIYWQPGGSRLAIVTNIPVALGIEIPMEDIPYAPYNTHISLWDTQSGKKVYTFETYPSEWMLWSTDGKYIESFPLPSKANPHPPGNVIWIAE